MRVMFTINADKAGAQEAEELKNKIEDLCKEYGLDGSARGDGYATGASYNGTYQTKKSKKDKPKSEPKYNPSQYLKVEKKGKKEKKEKKQENQEKLEVPEKQE